MNCRICGEPVVLGPSARERADRGGGSPSDYTSLFTTHTGCAMREYREGQEELMRYWRERHAAEHASRVVSTFTVRREN